MLKRRALIATSWSAGEIVLRQGVQFAATMVLARLLSPSDFGAIAMLALFVGVAGVLADGGFSAALVQRRDVDRVDESSVFWCNLAIGLLLSLLLFGAAPLIAGFYGDPALEPLMRVLSANCTIAALGSIHASVLTRKLDFKTQAKAGAAAGVLSASVGIALAALGYGAWALVAQALVMTGTVTGLLWILHPWRPAWVVSGSSLRKLWAFGGFHLASGLLEMVYARLYALLIGRLFGARAVGFYSLADNTTRIPGNFLSALVTRVALPLFSEAARDLALLQRGMQLALRGMMLVHAPVMLVAAALAEPLIVVLFGDRWASAAPILRILCLAGLLFPLHAINLQVLMAQGHARVIFRSDLLKKFAGLLLLGAGALHGVLGLAWSQVAYSLVVLAVNAVLTRRLVGYGVAAQLAEIAPVLLAATVAAIGATVASRAWDAPALVELVLVGGGSGLLYVLLLVGAKARALRDIAALLRPGESR